MIKKSSNSNIEPIFGKERDGDIPHSNANIDKACDLLNYKVLFNFEDGINKTVDYFKSKK